MRNTLLAGIALAMALSVAAGDEIVFRGRVEEWNDDMIDEMTFVQPGPWGGIYDAVVVEPIDMSKTEIGGKGKGQEAANETAKLMPQWAQDSVRAGFTLGSPRLVTPEEAASLPPETRVVVLKWRCESIEPGSRAKRFWVGFGTGHGGITVSGSLVDRATGKELLTFRHTRLSGRGLTPTGGIYAHVLEEAGTESTRDVGKMLAVVIRTRPS